MSAAITSPTGTEVDAETLSQQIEDWIGSHVRAFSFYGGVTEAVVPDNLKSGVSRVCRYVDVMIVF